MANNGRRRPGNDIRQSAFHACIFYTRVFIYAVSCVGCFGFGFCCFLSKKKTRVLLTLSLVLYIITSFRPWLVVLAQQRASPAAAAAAGAHLNSSVGSC